MPVTIEAIRRLPRVIADAVWPEGGLLRCGLCGSSFRFTRAEAEAFLRRGWPRCCGATMTAETAGAGEAAEN
jgi:hypothetical protein